VNVEMSSRIEIKCLGVAMECALEITEGGSLVSLTVPTAPVAWGLRPTQVPKMIDYQVRALRNPSKGIPKRKEKGKEGSKARRIEGKEEKPKAGNYGSYLRQRRGDGEGNHRTGTKGAGLARNKNRPRQRRRQHQAGE
jgi:hypothetical protein